MKIKKSTQDKLNDFVFRNDLYAFHSEENLAKAICNESGELLKNYVWGPDWVKRYNLKDDNKKDEIADILIFCFYYLQEMGWNADELINRKIIKNINKYEVKNNEN